MMAKKTVSVLYDIFGNPSLDLHKILEGTNVEPDQVGYYEFESIGEGSVSLILYDKNKKRLQVKYVYR